MSARPPIQAEPSRPPELRALTYSAGSVAVIAVEGWLNGGSMRPLQQALAAALDQGYRHLVLDLRQLRSLDAEGVDLLWAGLRAVIRRAGSLATAGLRPSLQPPLDPLVPHGLKMHGTVRAAISARSDEDRSAP